MEGSGSGAWSKTRLFLKNGFQTVQTFDAAHTVAASESASSGAVLRAGTTARSLNTQDLVYHDALFALSIL